MANITKAEIKMVGVMGVGEVGKAIVDLYEKSEAGRAFTSQKEDVKTGARFINRLDVLHVCIPFKDPDTFVEAVRDAHERTEAKAVVIHSTVGPGVTKAIVDSGVPAVHSPVRGVHPNLYEGVVTFKKFIGSDLDEEFGEVVKGHFEDLGVNVSLVEGSVTTELGKLLSTTYYGLAIAFHEYAGKLCDLTGADFDVVMTEFNRTYNLGYSNLGMKHVVRPVLTRPGKVIGGHCVRPNAAILEDFFGRDDVTNIILSLGGRS